MIFGAIGTERLQVNDDTLWSGGPAAWDAPGARDALDEVRRLTLAGNFPGGTRSRATVGRLLRQGVAPAHVDPSYYQSHVPMQYGRDGGTPGGQWGPGEMPRPHHGRRTLPGMRFGLALGIAAEGGEVSVSPAGWRVQGATAATLIVATATGFNGFDRDPAREGRDPGPILVQQIDRALAMPGLACGTITSRMTARSSIASPSRCRPARPTTSRPIAASAIAAVAIPASSSCWRTADIRRGG